MLQKFIKNIQAKPEPVRKSITLGTSLGITGIVGFFWLISFLNYSSEVLLAKPKTESPTNFLNKMGSLIGESYANVRTKIDDASLTASETAAPVASLTVAETVTAPVVGNVVTPLPIATVTVALVVPVVVPVPVVVEAQVMNPQPPSLPPPPHPANRETSNANRHVSIEGKILRTVF